MPQVIIAAAITAGATTAFASAAAIAAGGAFFGIAAGTAAAYFATSFATTLVLGAVSQALAKKPSYGGTLQSQGQTVTSKQPIAPHVVVYGRTRIGGTIVHLESTENNKFLHFVIVVAGHEIDAFEDVYFDDTLIGIDGNGFGFEGKAYSNTPFW